VKKGSAAISKKEAWWVVMQIKAGRAAFSHGIGGRPRARLALTAETNCPDQECCVGKYYSLATKAT